MGTQTHFVEQITKKGLVVLDRDQPLSRIQQQQLFKKYFKDVTPGRDGFKVTYRNKSYILLTKNITYLGHPWAVFKKRIQVPSRWNGLLKEKNVLLMGLYHYRESVLFVFFSKKVRGKNSAAHISSIDLLKAQQYGSFEKKDKNGNIITVCTPDRFLITFAQIIRSKRVNFSEEITLLEAFFDSLPNRWDGIKSYKEMQVAKFRHRRQAEWPGFYAEHRLSTFLGKLPPGEKTVCAYVQNKGKGLYDFDLEFQNSNFLGDLKTHSVDSAGIPGNDKKMFLKALNEYGRLWYVVLNLSFEHDRNFDCTVSRFWNNLINKEENNTIKKPTSYCQRMKHSSTLVSMNILEFNQFNKKYISDFTQGKQPNGSLREVKIQIEKKNIDNFVIYRKTL